MGTLFVDTAKRNEHYSFEYSDEWLKETKFSYQLDPDIFFYSGRQFPSNMSLVFLPILVLTDGAEL